MAEEKSTRPGKKLIDLTGQRFGRLTVISRGPNKGPSAAWNCRCDCGKERCINGISLRGGRSLSCGCKRVDAGHARILPMIGRRFHRYVVVAQAGSNPKGRALWQCQCDCGEVRIMIGKYLRSGHIKSCGCLRVEVTGNYSRTHGMTGTPEHRSWKHAKERCFNPDDASYENYGGRGITMCQEWAESFEAFYAHIGPKPKGLTLDRIDNERGYEPGNVRWATYSQQSYNRRPKRWRHKPHKIN